MSEGELISISFFDISEYTFLERQVRLQENFYISCACGLCMEQSAHHFALRCDNCNGPVPFEPILFPNGKCLRCEAKLASSSTAADILADLNVISNTIALLSGVGGASSVVTSGQLRYLEGKLGKLTSQVDLHNRQFLKSVAGLSEKYIHLKQYGSAITWYQWFVDILQVHLYQLECAEDGKEDIFGNYSALSKWASAYLAFIESALSCSYLGSKLKLKRGKKQQKQSKNGVVRPRHFTTAKYLLKKMFALEKNLQFNYEHCDDEPIIGREQYELLIQSIKQSAKVRRKHFGVFHHFSCSSIIFSIF